ncbi:MAG: hypothetical protein Q9160_007820 [Pyrenula sp. 1 TL-2023]
MFVRTPEALETSPLEAVSSYVDSEGYRKCLRDRRCPVCRHNLELAPQILGTRRIYIYDCRYCDQIAELPSSLDTWGSEASLQFDIGEKPIPSRLRRLKTRFKEKVEKCRKALGINPHKGPKMDWNDVDPTNEMTEKMLSEPYEGLELCGDIGRASVVTPDRGSQYNCQISEIQSHQIFEMSGHECAVEMPNNDEDVLSNFVNQPLSSDNTNDLQIWPESSYDTGVSCERRTIAMEHAFDWHQDSVRHSKSRLHQPRNLSVNFSTLDDNETCFVEQPPPSTPGFTSSVEECQQAGLSKELEGLHKYTKISSNQNKPFEYRFVDQQVDVPDESSLEIQASKFTSSRKEFYEEPSSLSAPSTSTTPSRYDSVRASYASDNRLEYSSTNASSVCSQNDFRTKDHHVYADRGQRSNGMSMTQRPTRPKISMPSIKDDQYRLTSFEGAGGTWAESPASISTQGCVQPSHYKYRLSMPNYQSPTFTRLHIMEPLRSTKLLRLLAPKQRQSYHLNTVTGTVVEITLRYHKNAQNVD